MSSEPTTFGQRILAASLAERMDLDTSGGSAEAFRSIDKLVARLVRRTLRGTKLVSLQSENGLSLSGLSTDEQHLLNEVYALDRQQARGAWFIPEVATVRAGVINFPSYLRHYARHATGIALEERHRVSMTATPESVFAWSILEPLFTELFAPFQLRGPKSGTREAADEIADWASFDAFCSAINVQIGSSLRTMRYGGGWGRLRADEQVDVKRQLMEVIADQVDNRVGARYRSLAVGALVERYYTKAKAGRAKRRQVVSKEFAPTLAGFFGGDWLVFLAYIEEEPHPDEHVATALSETRLYVGRQDQVASAAARSGLPEAEVELMLKTYWGDAGTASPVLDRVGVLKRYWHAFDEAHARQEPGMRPLWGLVEEGELPTFDVLWHAPYQPGVYRELLPLDVVADVDRLWGAVMLAKWPDRAVSEPFPHKLMAEAFGSALELWHGCALTTWFICEGPTSRTDLPGLAEYHASHIDALAALGCPVDPSLFVELRLAERRLGPPKPISVEETSESVHGFTFKLGIEAGERREGFDILRDIVTRHRRTWTTRYLDTYLRARWEFQLRDAGRAFNLLLAEKQKAPTLKQFTKHAVSPTNHWFGGDVRGLYGAIGQKAPQCPDGTTLMPPDRLGFAWSVFRAMGGRSFERKVVVASREEGLQQAEEQDRYHSLVRLAQLSFWFVQLQEALRRNPDPREFGSNFVALSTVLAENADTAWTKYVDSIEEGKRVCSSIRSASDPITLAETEDAKTSSQPGMSMASDQSEKPNAPWLSRILGRRGGKS